MKQRNPILIEVFASFGSATKLAAHLGISRSAVGQWQIVPLRYLREISRVTNIPKAKLRPDLYDE
jgi:hypothetical protein